MWTFVSTSFIYHNVFEVYQHCSMYHYFIPFHQWIVFNYMDIPLSVYPCDSWQPFELFTHFGYRENSLGAFMYEYLFQHMFSNIWGIELKVEMLSLHVTLGGTAKLVYHSGFTILHSHKHVWRFYFLHILVNNTCYFLLLLLLLSLSS